MTKSEADEWMLAQVQGKGVHYRQDGDAETACGMAWEKSTAARDFVTCESCRAIMRRGDAKAAERGPIQYPATVGRDPPFGRRFYQDRAAARAEERGSARAKVFGLQPPITDYGKY